MPVKVGISVNAEIITWILCLNDISTSQVWNSWMSVEPSEVKPPIHSSQQNYVLCVLCKNYGSAVYVRTEHMQQ